MPPRARTSFAAAPAAAAPSRDPNFEIWLGKKLAKRNLTELLRAWDKGGDGEISHDEFKAQIKILGYDGSQSDVDRFIRTIDADGSGNITLVELKEPIKKLVDAAMVYVKDQTRRQSIAAVEDERQAAINFLTDRKEHFRSLFDEAEKMVSNPPSEHLVAMKLAGQLDKVNGLSDLQKLWDRDGDGKITKPEFRDKVSTILNYKLKFQDIKELDVVFESMDADKTGSLEISEMQPGLEALKVRWRESRAQQKFMADHVDEYRQKMKVAEVALKASLEAQVRRVARGARSPLCNVVCKCIICNCACHCTCIQDCGRRCGCLCDLL